MTERELAAALSWHVYQPDTACRYYVVVCHLVLGDKMIAMNRVFDEGQIDAMRFPEINIAAALADVQSAVLAKAGACYV